MMPTRANQSATGLVRGVCRGPGGMYPLRRGLKILFCVILLNDASSRALVGAAEADPRPHSKVPSATDTRTTKRASAVTVAQVSNLLYRRLPACGAHDCSTRRDGSDAQPIGNRRYSRL